MRRSSNTSLRVHIRKGSSVYVCVGAYAYMRVWPVCVPSWCVSLTIQSMLSGEGWVNVFTLLLCLGKCITHMLVCWNTDIVGKLLHSVSDFAQGYCFCIPAGNKCKFVDWPQSKKFLSLSVNLFTRVCFFDKWFTTLAVIKGSVENVGCLTVKSSRPYFWQCF